MKKNRNNKFYELGKLFIIGLTLVFIVLNFNSSVSNISMPDKKYRIYINKSTNQFMVDGKRIWINGVNTPWNNWNDFGGSYNNSWWNNEFARLKQNGINAARVWINCSHQNNSLTVNNSGIVSAGSGINNHWSHLDQLFALAAQHKIYIMATLISFDHFKPPQSGRDNSRNWRAMLNSNDGVASFVNTYTIPFVNRYKDNPYLWSIDICNEPDWVNEEQKVGWNRISYFLAANAAAIHENSDILVTVGMAYAKWNTGNNNASGNNEGNKVSDQYLKSLYNNNPMAVLDFWSPHYYGWNGEWYGVAHYLKPNGGARQKTGRQYYGGYGFTVDAGNPAKPAVIGECSAGGTNADERAFIRAAEQPPVNNIINDYEYAYNNGWQGVMAWTSNGVDGNGGLSNTSLGQATQNMKNKYPQLIYPLDN